jgi:hypothetical protein
VASVEMENNIGTGLKPTGKLEVTPTATTTYVLRAIDNRGNAVTRSVTVTVSPAEAAPIDPSENPDSTVTPPTTSPPP